MMSKDNVIVDQAVDILKKIRTEPGYGIQVAHGVQDYFLGPAENKSIFSEEYRKRLRFLYVLDALLKKEPSLQKTFREIKQKANYRKTGIRSNDMEQRLAFVWVAIEREK